MAAHRRAGFPACFPRFLPAGYFHYRSNGVNMMKHKKTEQQTLDFGWLEEILAKRVSNYSTVACVATSDPKRLLQLKAYVAVCRDFAGSDIYSFNPWNGLEQMKRGDRGHVYFEPVKIQATEPPRRDDSINRILNLHLALRCMDEILRQRRTVLIIEYVDNPRDEEKERVLLYALRAWAHEPQLLRHGSFIVVVAGSFSKVLDELTRECAILSCPPLPHAGERSYIINDTARELSLDLKGQEEGLVTATSGLNLHQLESALREGQQRAGEVSIERVRELKNDFIKNSEILEMLEPVSGGFASLGGYQSVKDFVLQNIVQVLKEEERARRLSLSLPRGFILFGPPGTGKSLFARCLATEVNLPVINFRTEPLISKWLGESGHRFDDAIRIAEQMSPAILFVDEVDKLLIKRSGDGGDGAAGEMRRVTNQVLGWLGDKNRKSIFVGATNRPQDLDEAAIRAGRIDYMIPMLYPDTEARKQILRVHLESAGGSDSVPLQLSAQGKDELLDYIARESGSFSGAELESLVDRAKRYAFMDGSETVATSHFMRALNTFHIDLESRRQQEEVYLQLAREYATNIEFLHERFVQPQSY